LSGWPKKRTWHFKMPVKRIWHISSGFMIKITWSWNTVLKRKNWKGKQLKAPAICMTIFVVLLIILIIPSAKVYKCPRISRDVTTSNCHSFDGQDNADHRNVWKCLSEIKVSVLFTGQSLQVPLKQGSAGFHYGWSEAKWEIGLRNKPNSLL
jgi:hypothetical protein